MHTNVTVNYLGLDLRSPIIVGACPLTLLPESVREFAIAGAGAVVLPSLLQEQVIRRMLNSGIELSKAEQQLESAGGAGREDEYNGGVDAYLQTISNLKHCAGIPVIANLNGCTDGRWLSISQEIERAGADAIELSLDPSLTDPSLSAEQIESPILRAVESVSDAVSIPISVKLLPFYSSLPNLLWRLAEAGADGTVLFAREPVWEIRDGDLVATSHWSLSDAGQLQTTLSGLIRARSGGPDISIAASGGITTERDVLTAITAGADVAMVTSELYRTGPDTIAHMLDGVINHLRREGIESFDQFRKNCKEARERLRNRQRQLRPMLDRQDYRDPHPEPAQQTGDRWGHTYPSPLDD